MCHTFEFISGAIFLISSAGGNGFGASVTGNRGHSSGSCVKTSTCENVESRTLVFGNLFKYVLSAMVLTCLLDC